jgi:Permuted papain-like amidase enzyme, YaeF/YiiX, C92 family
MKKLLRFAFALSLVLASAAGWLAIWLARTNVSAAEMPPLKSGDIVFQSSGDAQSNAIGMASRSLYTHTALIEVDAAGNVNAVEAVGPVKTTPLDQWIKYGTGQRITVKRVKGLSDDAARKALAAAHAYDGRPYDHFFHESRDAIYCSELVHLAFKEGPSINIGAIQRVKDLHIDNAPARALIESRWHDHPMCLAAKATTFDACYALILEQTLVTPASVARDPKLETVYSNFGVAAD